MALPAHNVSDSVALQVLVEASKGCRCGGSCIAIGTARATVAAVGLSLSLSLVLLLLQCTPDKSVCRSGRRSVGTVGDCLFYLSVCHLSGIISFVLHPSSAGPHEPLETGDGDQRRLHSQTQPTQPPSRARLSCRRRRRLGCGRRCAAPCASPSCACRSS